MSMEVAYRVGWAWDVEFARWTSPDSTAFKVQIIAPGPIEAIHEAAAATARILKDEARNLELRRLLRREPVHGVAGALKEEL